METSALESDSLAEKMVELANALGSVKGKKQYGYLPKRVKELVDAITDELALQPDVAACYQVWNDLRDELERYYKDKPRIHTPLSKQKEFKAQHPEWFTQYPKFSKMLAKVLDSSDEIKSAATVEKIVEIEKKLGFILPTQVREFFLITEGVNVSTGLSISLSQLFNLTIHEEHYCVLGEFWKEADGDLLLLRPGEETVWYYAHEQDKVKFLRNTMYELLEKELVNYLREN